MLSPVVQLVSVAPRPAGPARGWPPAGMSGRSGRPDVGNPPTGSPVAGPPEPVPENTRESP
ncbi:hypothetical protein ACFPM0_35705 [Pseudonocardia sulfidoxydans]|uniref:hypothetical protein n=1 Tax=Pseudonocardia sulfidoxydans TaxID=54011 RepID=UPI003607B1B7